MKKITPAIIVSLLLATGLTLDAQGSLSNQVLRLLSRINTWTALQTYDAPNGGIIKLGRQTVPQVTETDRLENIGGNLYFNGVVLASSSSAGTVTSVAATVPSILAISGSPITSSGTLAITLATESANLTFAGPASGSAATPTFRALVNADLPLSGVSAATYPKVTVNTRGVVTAGFSQIDLTADVTGVLPLANGGNGIGTAANSTVLVSSGSAWVAKTITNCLGGSFTFATASNSFGCNAFVTVGGTGAATSSNVRLKETTAGLLSVVLGDDSGAANAQIGKLALGNNADNTFANGVDTILSLQNTYTGALTAQPLDLDRHYLLLSPSGNATQTAYAGDFFLETGSIRNFSSGLDAINAFVDAHGTGTIHALGAVSAYVETDAGQTATNTIGGYFGTQTDGAGTTNYGLWVDSNYGSGTITTNYGLFIADQTYGGTATNNYALFYNAPASKTFSVKATGDASVGGSLFIGTLAYSAPRVTAASGAPSGACVTGSIYLRTDGGAASSVYFCDNAVWSAFGTPATGVLAAAQGGTGFDGSAAANGRLPVGNGSGFTLAALTGTANQVVVSNGAGTITLSAPQGIGTTSTPQFARLGLGTGAGATAVITTAGQVNTGYFDAGSSGATKIINLNSGMVQKLLLTANTTLTINNPIAGVAYYRLDLTQDGTGSRLVTWPGSVLWTGGAAPTLTTTPGAIDVCTLMWNGTNYLAACTLDFE